MLNLGGAVTLMQVNSNEALDRIEFLVGDKETVTEMQNVLSLPPFSDDICLFLNELSDKLVKLNISRLPDIATLAFWIRKASIQRLKQRFLKDDGEYRLGRGVIFHIAPSNVPVNFAYSLVSGLITGNANIVRVPSKDFEQVGIISTALNEVLGEHESLRPYIALIRYERDKDINDHLSMLADVRVIWGGDATIAELRKSPLKSRAVEVTFADRYSLSIIDSDAYLDTGNREGVAQDFYNDTFLTDQNACTSPFLVVWTGSRKQEAKEAFWNSLHRLVFEKYGFQDIQAVNKLTSEYMVMVAKEDARSVGYQDNLIVRVAVDKLDADLYEFKENSGFFFEYDCDDIEELAPICDNTKCQTVGYIGDKTNILRLLDLGIRGIDRIVPIGKTMDFDLIWDGYDLVDRFTRNISLR